MTAKEYLEQYRRLELKLAHLHDELDRLEEQEDSISINLDGMPHAEASDSPTGDLVDKLLFIKEQYVKVMKQCVEKRSEILEVVDSIEDCKCSKLLYKRYIEGKLWFEIADEMHYSFDHVKGNMHKKALEMVDRVLKDNTQ